MPSPIMRNTGTPSIRDAREPKSASTSTRASPRPRDEPAHAADAALPTEGGHAGPRTDARPPRRRRSAATTAGRHPRPRPERARVVHPAVVALATTGIMTFNACRQVGGAATATAQSRIRPTCIVEGGRRASRGSTPSRWRKPVSSPAPLSTAPPAGIGRREGRPRTGKNDRDAGSCDPTPAGGPGSSRVTVTSPTDTPGTSVIASSGPARGPAIRRRCTAQRRLAHGGEPTARTL